MVENSITNSISNSNSNGSIAFKRDSMKSYVSYDSAFSVFNESNGNSNGNSFKIENTTTEYNGLKRKLLSIIYDQWLIIWEMVLI